MALWTFIVDFEGGTYVGQGAAATYQAACIDWAQKVRRENVLQRRTATYVKALLKASTKAVPLNDLQNAWCFTGLFAGELFIVNVVLTSQSACSLDDLARLPPASN